MGKRRKAREVVLNALYLREMSGEALSELICRIKDADYTEEIQEYAIRLLQATLNNLEAIDTTLTVIIKNWALGRVAIIDKCVLRLAAAEMLYVPDVPVKVSIDEAVEIAKTYSTENSGGFVNGILDEIARQAHLI
jgi:transcription antitermination factor NusB